MTKFLTLAITLMSSSTFAAISPSASAQKADSIYHCSIADDGKIKGDLRVFLKENSSKTEIIDVEFAGLETGISANDQVLSEQNGVLKVNSRENSEKKIVVDANAKVLSMQGSPDLSLEDCRFE